jgi:hypothetical protein
MSLGGLSRLCDDALKEASAKGGRWRRSGRRADQRVYLGVGGHALSALVASGYMRGDDARFIGWQRSFREGGERRRGRVAIRARPVISPPRASIHLYLLLAQGHRATTSSRTHAVSDARDMTPWRWASFNAPLSTRRRLSRRRSAGGNGAGRAPRSCVRSPPRRPAPLRPRRA